jgi:hypothetical protein
MSSQSNNAEKTMESTVTNPQPIHSPIDGDGDTGSALSSSSVSKFSTNGHQDSQLQLKVAVRESRDAEALHAFDIGVMASLVSMMGYWDEQCENRHISVSEKRIFRREADRLERLLIRAQEESAKSEKTLDVKLAEEKRLADTLMKAQVGITVVRGRTGGSASRELRCALISAQERVDAIKDQMRELE